MNNFIKIANPELAQKLSSLGFQYIQENTVFAFLYDEKLIALLQSEYATVPFVCENKLSF